MRQPMRNQSFIRPLFVLLQRVYGGRMMVQKTGHGFPNKQPLLPTKQIIFSNTQPAYDYLNSSKYAELFINPSLNPNMYSFENPVPAYPLDTVIPNSTYPTPQKTSHDLTDRVGGASNGLGVQFTVGNKGATNSELENLLTMPTTKAVSPSTELDNLFKMSESDFTSLMSTFVPRNTEPQERGSGDFAIPSATTGIFDTFPPGLFSEGGSSPSSSSASPPTMMMQQPMDTWRGEGDKWARGMNFASNSLPLPPGEAETPTLWSSPPSTSHSELTPLLEAFPPLDRDLPLPSSSPHSHFHTPSVSPSRNTPTDLHIQNLTAAAASSRGQSLSLEEQLDFFDIPQDWDVVLPPMKRLMGSPLALSEASSPVSHMHISPPPPPAPSSPASPVETKPIVAPLSSSSSSSSSEKLAKSSPLLFGQSEDEILVKVLAHHPGPDSKPITRERLVSMPVEEFNRLLDVTTLNEIEVAFMKEWRRRGKNKTAAMIARKRKRDELTDLDDEVEQLRKQKAGLRSKYEQLKTEIVTLKARSKAAEERVYQRYSRQSGVHVSRDSHVIHVDKSGKVLLGPRVSSQQMLLVK